MSAMSATGLTLVVDVDPMLQTTPQGCHSEERRSVATASWSAIELMFI